MKYKNKQRLIGIREVIRQRGKNYTTYSLTNIQRWLYSFKAIICLLLNKRKNCWAQDSIVSMAMLNCYLDLKGCDWTELAVGVGLFKGWHYDIYSNSSS